MQNIKRVAFTSVLLGALALGSYIAYAASDGTLGTTSTGTSVVSLTIAERFRISNMNDISFGTYSGTGNLSGNDDICIYTNGDGTYKVTLTDNTTLTPTAFAVQDSTNTYSIPMTVRWNNTSGTSGNAAITYNTSYATTGANVVSQDCSSGGLSANIAVNLLQADLQTARAGNYASTITIIVEAD